MIPCKDIQQVVSAYLDRQLASGDLAEVRLHLETCAACRAEERSILQLKETLRTVSMPSIPADLIASIEAETIFKPRWWEAAFLGQRLAPALVGLALGLGAWFYFAHAHHAWRSGPVNVALSPTVSSAPVVAMHRDQEPDLSEKIH